MGCGGEGDAAGSSSRPATAPAVAPSASAVAVGRAWLGAVDAGDAAAGRRLETARFAAADAKAVDGWFSGNVTSVRDARVVSSTPGRGLVSNLTYAQVRQVTFRFDLQQERASSFRDGDTIWGLILVRNKAGEPWLIDDQGLG